MMSIKTWVEDVGGIEPAIAISPPLISFDGYSFEIMDGWHRLSLAALAGMTKVPVCIGLIAGRDPIFLVEPDAAEVDDSFTM